MYRSALHADTLADPATHAEASRMVVTMTEPFGNDNVALIPMLLALASTFVGLCDQQGIDASDAFEECAEALGRCPDAAAQLPLPLH